MTPALLLVVLLPLDLAGVAEKPCPLPERPAKLVLGVYRLVMPIGGSARSEAGQVTVDGDCEPNVECARVSEATLAKVAATVRAMGVVRHRNGAVSPHYGRREVIVRWRGGECRVADGYDGQIDDRDGERFSAAMQAIVGALLDARPGAKK